MSWPRPSRTFGPRTVEALEGRALLSDFGHHLRVHATQATGAQTYRQAWLVSDLPNVAFNQDTNLVNPWGIAFGPTTPAWVADNGKGVSTLYNFSGTPQPLVIKILPGSPGGTTPTPTGAVFNTTSVPGGTNDFKIPGTNMAATFIFVTEDGTIDAWNPALGTVAIPVVNSSARGAVFKGVALATNASGQHFLYATNFNDGLVEVFDTNFNLRNVIRDPGVPGAFSPFGIENIGGSNILLVTYAKADAAKHDDVPGPGRGFVDAFDPNGKFLGRVASRGALDAPWGLAIAPPTFGKFANTLLVGNFGDGRINSYSPSTSGGALHFVFAGQLTDQSGKPLTIPGLWGLRFGNNSRAGSANFLFFTAGINDEQNGLYGFLFPTPP